MVLASSVHNTARSSYFLRTRCSAKYQICQEFEIIIQCSPFILLRCIFLMVKVSLSRVQTQPEGKEPRHRYLGSGIQLNNCWRETLSVLDDISSNTKLVNCDRRHPCSQYNEFSNVQNSFVFRDSPFENVAKCKTCAHTIH